MAEIALRGVRKSYGKTEVVHGVSLDIAHGFGLLLDNPRVRALLINVHGGGMQSCDTVAEGLGIAMRRSGRTLPVSLCLSPLFKAPSRRTSSGSSKTGAPRSSYTKS